MSHDRISMRAIEDVAVTKQLPEQESRSAQSQPVLRINTILYQLMLDQLQSDAPNEGCGLIAVDGVDAVKLYPGTNIERSTTRYQMDPAEVASALSDMREHGWQLGAIYHSHPATEARPSETDIRLAYYPDSLMIIASLASDPPVVKAFQLDDPPVEVPLLVTGRAGLDQSDSRGVIGILGGMGPLATVDLYRKIIEATPAEHDQDHLHVVIEANPAIPDRTGALLNGGADPLPWLINGARRLQRAGASLIAMPCNTAHAFLPRVQASVSIPIINMIGETARQAASVLPSGSAVGILATEGTVRAGLYQSALRDTGLQALVPGAAAQGWVSQAIGMVKAGQIERGATSLVLRAVAELIADGAVALIAACTEIPIILNPTDVDVPLIDPTDVLARTAVRWASGQPGRGGFVARSGAGADVRRD